jgi:hypothetical protein
MKFHTQRVKGKQSCFLPGQQISLSGAKLHIRAFEDK